MYIYAEYAAGGWNPKERLERSGVMEEAFPCTPLGEGLWVPVGSDPYETTRRFGVGDKTSVWANAGVMQDGVVYTVRTDADYDGPRTILGDILTPADQVSDRYWIDDAKLPAWEYLKGAKKERRTAANGFEYTYSEGPVAFPDPLDRPSRTILTSEGGTGASRTKHAILQDGRYRRLVPDELDQLQMFPKGWTADGMTDGHRAFCMGNALVTGIPHRIGQVIASRHGMK